ncbi:MAG: amidohydrolase family protein [Victivallales bacterium]|nr:amidohydrolase family protein [Victivallales bacterium]
MGNILLENDRIAAIGNASEDTADTIINGQRLIAVPGFIDIHSHGRSNYDFCDGSQEAFSTIGRGKLQDGVTGFLATSLSVSEDALRNLCRQAEWYKENVADGASLLGIHLEGPFFNPSCAGAQNPRFLQHPRIGLVEELNAISSVKKVSFSPELPNGLAFTRQLRERGIMPSGGHSEADYECFEAARQAGMKHLTHFCNVMTPVHHLRFGMVGGGLMANDVYVEMICDGVHLCDQMIQMITDFHVIKSP